MENNQLHKSGANITWYNVAMKGFPLFPRTFNWTYNACFSLTNWPYETSIYLSVSTNEPSIKYEISSVMWEVSPKYKIQLVSCDLSSQYLLGVSALEYICAIDGYTFCELLSYVVFSDVLSIFVNIYAWVIFFSIFQQTFLSEVSGFRKFTIKWSSDPHLKGIFAFWPLCSARLLLYLRELKGDFLWKSCFPFCLKHF